MEILNDGMCSWESPAVWGARIEYVPAVLDDLRGRQLSYEDFENIASRIEKQSKDAYVDVPSLDLVMDCFDWTTGIDFGHQYDGGGYVISFSYGDDMALIDILVEWNDDYAVEAGLSEERSNQDMCVRIGLSLLNEFLAAL